MKKLIKHIDDIIDNPTNVRLMMWVGSLVIMFLTFVILLLVAPGDGEIGSQELNFVVDQFSLFDLNLMYFAGLLINLTLLVLYIRHSEKDLTHHSRKESVKGFFFYTIFGYGGFNLLVYPALVGLGVISGMILGVVTVGEHTRSFISGTSEKVIERLQKRNAN